ncbi:hypothetical protein DLJ53_24845 [Acuticoccus sediminis]|uniref:Acyl-CoA dehydrogenase n=1 Tax=Acuticoccus sediminis TaxID=2184697 RepID=A0A8B2NL94_9HYPH|nr:acyl-CoA dehydrogenase family protein [Acuticoccus sediminis]RAH98865.1 hypothetical protein DLJ53_24845 [Acuticoccus sediminis]
MTTADDEQLVLQSVDAFCERHLTPAEVQRRDEAHTPANDLLVPMAEMGLIRAPFPEAVGGIDLPWSSMCKVQERLSYSAYFAGSILNRVLSFGIMPLMAHGTEAQKDALLPGLFDGQRVIALALTEPDVGSDARAVKTRAVRKGDGWVLNGRKTWISDAGGASHLLTLCRTPEEGERSLTAFLVPTDAPGIAMTTLPKVGNNCMPSYDIGLDDVPVADEWRLADVGKGFAAVTSALIYSRASQAATNVGLAQSAADLATQYARERHQFGRAIGEFQVIKHRLVDMHTEVMKARLMVRELARRIDMGEEPLEIAAMAKITATEALQFVVNHGMQIMASAGYSMDSAMQRHWRDARLFTFGEGSNEIQREIIAKVLRIP